MRIDHVIYAVGDLDAAASHFREEFGLASVEGGRHPGWGTANRIVPLGDDYVELVTVVDQGEAAASEFGRAVTEAVARGRGLLGWAVATNDVQGVARRLSLEVTMGSRRRPDGSMLRWRLAGVAHALATGAFPFFIEWEGSPDLHPGAARAEHAAKPHGITRIDLTAPSESQRSWIGDHDLPLRIVRGEPALSGVVIGTANGRFVLR